MGFGGAKQQVPSPWGEKQFKPTYGLFLVSGLVDTSCANSAAFLAMPWPLIGHIVEIEGNKGLFVTRKSRRT